MKKLVFTLGLLVWLTVSVQAQTVPIFWERLESLEASITAVATGPDGTVFVGTEEGIYRSRNHGLSWEPLRAGLPEYASTGYVSALRVTPEGRLFYHHW